MELREVKTLSMVDVCGKHCTCCWWLVELLEGGADISLGLNRKCWKHLTDDARSIEHPSALCSHARSTRCVEFPAIVSVRWDTTYWICIVLLDQINLPCSEAELSTRPLTPSLSHSLSLIHTYIHTYTHTYYLTYWVLPAFFVFISDFQNLQVLCFSICPGVCCALISVHCVAFIQWVLYTNNWRKDMSI